MPANDKSESEEYKRFKRLAGGLLKVKPEELEEQQKKERAKKAGPLTDLAHPRPTCNSRPATC